MFYNSSNHEVRRVLARYVDRFLKGTKLSDSPIQQFSR